MRFEPQSHRADREIQRQSAKCEVQNVKWAERRLDGHPLEAFASIPFPFPLPLGEGHRVRGGPPGRWIPTGSLLLLYVSVSGPGRKRNENTGC